MTAQPRGMLDRDTLAALVEAGEIGTVLVAFPDMYGRLLGKRYDAGYFLEAADRGLHFCDYLLACDMEMNPVPGYQFTGWDRGYKDAWGDIDWSTLRRASWLDRSALCFATSGGSLRRASRDRAALGAAAPDRASARGRSAPRAPVKRSSSSSATLRVRARQTLSRPAHLRLLHRDYRLFRYGSEPLLAAIRSHLGRRASGWVQRRWGAGQTGINIRYADLDVMADRTTISSRPLRIAQQAGRDVHGEMARGAREQHHVHFSLWTGRRRNHFAPGAPTTADA